MEYKIIEAKGDAAELQDEVNRHIEDGWVPVGGMAVACSPQSYNWWYYQAMIRNPGAAKAPS